MGRLFSAHGGSVWRAVMAATAGRREIADDVTAEAFSRLLVYQDGVRDPLPWLFRTAFRLMAKELQRERQLDAKHVELDEGEHQASELPHDLLSALNALSVEQRIAVYLHYYADLPVSEVARISGSSTTAVKVRLHRARKQLRLLLDQEGVAGV
jgi:RNA polymerase sigma-70 factor, ECF subfamily